MYEIELELDFEPHIMAQLRSYALATNMTVEEAAKFLVEEGLEREMAKRAAEGETEKPGTDIVA